MRKLLVILSMICFGLSVTTVFGSQHDDHEIERLLDVVEQTHFEVEAWNVIYKEKIQMNSLHDIIEILNKKGNVKRTETTQSIKYSLIHTQKKEHITEAYEVVLSKKTQQVQATVSVEGIHSDSIRSEAFINTKQFLEKKIFTNAVQKYACIKSSSDDIIDDSKILEKLNKTLNFEAKVTQNEDITTNMNKKLIYGYSPKWDSYFTIKGHTVNTQLALTKDMNNRTTMIIGTPILISEY